MNTSDISDSELNDDDERIEVGSESTSFSAKRGRSSISESISTSSDKNESKRKRSRISSASEFSLAVDKLTSHLDGVKSALDKKDWVKEAVDILFSNEIVEALTEDELSKATTLLVDERKAKMLCLIPIENMKIVFLRREIEQM